MKKIPILFILILLPAMAFALCATPPAPRCADLQGHQCGQLLEYVAKKADGTILTDECGVKLPGVSVSFNEKFTTTFTIKNAGDQPLVGGKVFDIFHPTIAVASYGRGFYQNYTSHYATFDLMPNETKTFTFTSKFDDTDPSGDYPVRLYVRTNTDAEIGTNTMGPINYSRSGAPDPNNWKGSKFSVWINDGLPSGQRFVYNQDFTIKFNITHANPSISNDFWIVQDSGNDECKESFSGTILPYQITLGPNETKTVLFNCKANKSSTSGTHYNSFYLYGKKTDKFEDLIWVTWPRYTLAGPQIRYNSLFANQRLYLKGDEIKITAGFSIENDLLPANGYIIFELIDKERADKVVLREKMVLPEIPLIAGETFSENQEKILTTTYNPENYSDWLKKFTVSARVYDSAGNSLPKRWGTYTANYSNTPTINCNPNEPASDCTCSLVDTVQGIDNFNCTVKQGKISYDGPHVFNLAIDPSSFVDAKVTVGGTQQQIPSIVENDYGIAFISNPTGASYQISLKHLAPVPGDVIIVSSFLTEQQNITTSTVPLYIGLNYFSANPPSSLTATVQLLDAVSRQVIETKTASVPTNSFTRRTITFTDSTMPAQKNYVARISFATASGETITYNNSKEVVFSKKEAPQPGLAIPETNPLLLPIMLFFIMAILKKKKLEKFQ